MIASLCNSIGCLSRRIATFVSNKNAIRYAISPTGLAICHSNSSVCRMQLICKRNIEK